jgi:predicted 3-demethylubiquinone-9 3-methyltransferase (glyoxalase superfamily)
MPEITPCLWFDTEGEEAAAFYTSIFPGLRIVEVTRSSEAWPGRSQRVVHALLQMKKIEIAGLERAALAA